jgi:hypothetical protein
MTWSVSASGHTPTPEDAENWAAVEQELFDKLSAVLLDPKYGLSSSQFYGNFVSGPLTLKVESTEEGDTHGG